MLFVALIAVAHAAEPVEVPDEGPFDTVPVLAPPAEEEVEGTRALTPVRVYEEPLRLCRFVTMHRGSGHHAGPELAVRLSGTVSWHDPDVPGAREPATLLAIVPGVDIRGRTIAGGFPDLYVDGMRIGGPGDGVWILAGVQTVSTTPRLLARAGGLPLLGPDHAPGGWRGGTW